MAVSTKRRASESIVYVVECVIDGRWVPVGRSSDDAGSIFSFSDRKHAQEFRDMMPDKHKRIVNYSRQIVECMSDIPVLDRIPTAQQMKQKADVFALLKTTREKVCAVRHQKIPLIGLSIYLVFGFDGELIAEIDREKFLEILHLKHDDVIGQDMEHTSWTIFFRKDE